MRTTLPAIRLLAALVLPGLAGAPARAAEPLVCFTPGQDCTGLIVQQIRVARHSIRVQAYSFTSVPILSALKAAHARGVDVEVIVDKTSARVSKSGSRYSAATYLSNAGIPVWVDTQCRHRPQQGHGDRRARRSSPAASTLPAAAQSHNAENLLVVTDPALAKLYDENWSKRRSVSTRYTEPLPKAPTVEE